MVGGEEQRRTLRNYVTPGSRGQIPSISKPPMTTNTFEQIGTYLNGAIISIWRYTYREPKFASFNFS